MSEVGGHINRFDARRLRGGRPVPDDEARVGVGAAHEIGGKRAFRGEVGGVTPGAANELVVLDAPDRLADPKFHRCHRVNLSVWQADGQRFVNPRGRQSKHEFVNRGRLL